MSKMNRAQGECSCCGRTVRAFKGQIVDGAVRCISSTVCAGEIVWQMTRDTPALGTATVTEADRAKKPTIAQLNMLRDVASRGYVSGRRAAHGTPRLEAMGLIERKPSGLYKLTAAGLFALETPPET